MRAKAGDWLLVTVVESAIAPNEYGNRQYRGGNGNAGKRERGSCRKKPDTCQHRWPQRQDNQQRAEAELHGGYCFAAAIRISLAHATRLSPAARSSVARSSSVS